MCGPGVVQKYLNRISGPLLDRIDLHVEVTPVNFDELSSTVPSEGSRSIRLRVEKARKIQRERFNHREGMHCNAQMSKSEFEANCQLDEPGMNMLKMAMNKLGLSARAYDRIIKVARTIADLDASGSIQSKHIAEAIQYRSLDRGNWGTIQ